MIEVTLAMKFVFIILKTKLSIFNVRMRDFSIQIQQANQTLTIKYNKEPVFCALNCNSNK